MNTSQRGLSRSEIRRRESQSIRQRQSIIDLRSRYRRNDTTLWRWYTTGKPGYCNFPAPHYLNGHRYWWLDEIEEWERAHTQTHEERGAA